MKKWIGWVVAGLILITSLVFLNKKNDQFEIEKYNYETSISNLKYTLDSTTAVRDLYILERDEAIEKLNLSKKEVKKLEKEIGNKSSIIARISSQIKIDTTYITDTVIVENNADYVAIRADNKWYKLEIDYRPGKTTLNRLEMNVPLTTGLAGNKIWVKSDNPYVRFSEIEGAILEPKKIYKQKLFNWGIQLGVGCQYGILNQRFDIGPYIGIGCEINL